MRVIWPVVVLGTASPWKVGHGPQPRISWPLIQRRLSPGRDVGTLEATRLINSSNAVLLDIRETKEYEGGRLPRALHIPLSQLASRDGELSRYAGKPIVVYCTAGNRAGGSWR